MQKFQFSLDEKGTIWFRTKFEIEAESLDIAKEEALNKLKTGEFNYPWEPLEDTIELITPEQNYGEPTIELYSMEHGDHDPIFTNKITNKNK
jgi:hypothetical protein